MDEDPIDRSLPTWTWRRAGKVAGALLLAIVAVAIGLVLTGIIAEPETVIGDFFRLVLGE